MANVLTEPSNNIATSIVNNQSKTMTGSFNMGQMLETSIDLSNYSYIYDLINSLIYQLPSSSWYHLSSLTSESSD